MPLILGTNSIKDTGYDVANSLRFNSGSSDKLSKTFGSAGNRKTFTISTWIKRASSSGRGIIDVYSDGSNYALIQINSDEISAFDFDGSSVNFNLNPSRKLRDFSAWYNIVFAVDTTQSTASNRVKIYINGSQETVFDTETYPSQNYDMYFNDARPHNIGTNTSGGHFFDGYMAEFCFIDGQQLDPTSFGEFDSDTNIWKPIDVSGLTFGTNGFYLNVPGPSTGQNSNGLGGDSSGNGNHFASSGLSAEDQSSDTCTNNFATFNTLWIQRANNVKPQFTNGNLTAIFNNSGTNEQGVSTIGVSTGKWYCEIKWDSATSNTATNTGIFPVDYFGGDPFPSAYIYLADGTIRSKSSASSYGNSYTNGDIIGIALDLDNNKLYFSKNGTWQNSGDPTSGSTGTGAISISADTYYFYCSDYASSGNRQASANFGSPPYSISSGNSDGNGYGNFEYSVPSGYYALNTKNLAEYG